MKPPDCTTYQHKMMVSHNDKMQMICYKDMICLKATGNYIEITVNNSTTSYYTLQSLNQLEKLLSQQIFFRSHRSTIVNIAYIQ